MGFGARRCALLAGPPVLRDASFTAAEGEFVALVGASGSGKSTLLRLLLGFETPEGGAVLHDRQELARLDVRAVRRQIGVVLQGGRLMAGTLMDNIAGGSRATLEDAQEAARQAGLEPKLAQMPMGLFTYVTDGGTTLSGGQGQKVLLARALALRRASSSSTRRPARSTTAPRRWCAAAWTPCAPRASSSRTG